MLVDQYGMLGLAMMYKHRDDSQNELDNNISIIIGKGQTAKSILNQANKSIVQASQEYSQQLEQREEKQQSSKQKTSSASLQLPNNEYNMQSIKDKLPNMTEILEASKDDLLFNLFYVCCDLNDLQSTAYSLLVARNWVYNKDLKLWIKQCKNNELNANGGSSSPSTSTSNLQDLYYVFDVNSWQVKKINLNNFNNTNLEWNPWEKNNNKKTWIHGDFFFLRTKPILYFYIILGFDINDSSISYNEWFNERNFFFLPFLFNIFLNN